VGDDLRITAQLIGVANGYHLWSETYDRTASDIFAIQRESANAITGTLRRRLVAGGDTARLTLPTVDVDAYNLYLQGRYRWHRRTADDLAAANEFFRQAVERAPGYAPAHVGLADALAVRGFYDYLPPREAFPAARRAAEQALAIDPTSAAAHATLGYVALYYDWDWPEAEAEFRRSIALDPSYSTGHQWYANFLTARGRFAEAEAEMRLATEVDPLSLIANAALGWLLLHSARYDDAIAQFRRTLTLDPDFQPAHLWMGIAQRMRGDTTGALASLRRAVDLSRGSAITVAALTATQRPTTIPS